MQITSIDIKNFRCIKDLHITLNGDAVIIGENNAGKSAILDAVKIALGRRWGRSGGNGFNEYDFRTNADDSRGHATIEVSLTFSETTPDEWSDDITSAFNDIIRTDPFTGIDSIRMRVRCSFEEVTKLVEPEWQFINDAGEPYSGKGGRNQNISNFFNYVPCFSMAAMRDASIEFTGRSRFWGSLLKSIDIDKDLSASLELKFAELNDELLGADPKLDKIKETLKSISNVIAVGAAGDVDVRAVPTSLWDIISRAELIVRGKEADPWLPIHRHGNGVQSLAVMFLFRAYVENMLAETLTPDSAPVLTLEEPEAHLHPQACRALWDSILTLPGQKIITTHSPYFVQNVPLKDLIILRRGEQGPKGCSIKQRFTAVLPKTPAVGTAIKKYHKLLSYDDAKCEIVCDGVLEETAFRELLMCFTGADRNEHHHVLRALKTTTNKYVSDDEISRLESWAKRIRGEIFFARQWILCEGQAEYAILGAIAEKTGKPLDAHGIALIDYQNNGAPGAFAALARALGFEWVMICDGDSGGDDHIAQLKARRFSDGEIGSRVIQLPRGVDLECLIVRSALRPLILAAIQELDPSVADDDGVLLAFAGGHKEEVAVRLARQVRMASAPLTIPEEFTKLFQRLEGGS